MFYFSLIRKLLENGIELPVDCFKEDSNMVFDILFHSFLVMPGMTEGFPLQIFKDGS